jgi:hypothetical protein
MRSVATACVLLGLAGLYCDTTPTNGPDASASGAGGAGTSAGGAGAGAGGAGTSAGGAGAGAGGAGTVGEGGGSAGAGVAGSAGNGYPGAEAGDEAGTAEAGDEAGAEAGTAEAGGDSMCVPTCSAGLRCCGVECINPLNDVRNCGQCGHVCPGLGPYMMPDRTSFCDLGTCGPPPCSQGWCDAETRCCGTQCCGGSQICCHVPGPTGPTLQCIDAVGGRCPKE